MVRQLTEREIGTIVKLRGLGYTQQEIADRIGVTAAAVSYQLKRINKIAKRDGEDNTLMLFLVAAGLGFIVGRLFSSDNNNETQRR